MDDIRTMLGPNRLVPVIVLDDPRNAAALGKALARGGLAVAEVTFRTAHAAESIRAIADQGDVLVGAGTVVSTAQVDAAVAAGARFIVSPGFSRPVVERALEAGVTPLPGAITPSEVMAALDLGLTTVKFFPAATAGGPGAIAALAAPFAGLSFVPTGGIGPGNVADYLAIPAVAAVGGSWMVPRDALNDGAWDRVTSLVRSAVAAAGSKD